MAPPERPEDEVTDPVTLVMMLGELAGAALAIWYLYRVLRQDPEFEAWRSKVIARVDEIRAQRRFSRVSTVVPEAAYILSEGAPNE